MPRIKHAVLMRFRADAPQAAIDRVYASLAALKGVIPGLVDFSGGANCSVEGLTHGFTHGFVTTFADAAARDAYLPHPDHEEVKAMIVELLDGGLDGVAVLDWEDR